MTFMQIGSEILNHSFKDIEDQDPNINSKLTTEHFLPQTERQVVNTFQRDALRETSVDIEALEMQVEGDEGRLNDDGKIVYDHILASVQKCERVIFF